MNLMSFSRRWLLLGFAAGASAIVVVACGDSVPKYDGLTIGDPNNVDQTGSGSAPADGGTSTGSGGASGGSKNLCECALAFAAAQQTDECGKCADPAVGNECLSQNASCGTDTDCMAAQTCLSSCKGDATCVAACITPGTSSFFLALEACVCELCASKCAPKSPIDDCSVGIDGGTIGQGGGSASSSASSSASGTGGATSSSSTGP